MRIWLRNNGVERGKFKYLIAAIEYNELLVVVKVLLLRRWCELRLSVMKTDVRELLAMLASSTVLFLDMSVTVSDSSGQEM